MLKSTTTMLSVTIFLFGTSALAEETTSAPTSAAASAVQHVVSLTSGPTQDTQFLALLRARDGKLVQIQELKRILTFHDSFRGRFEKLLAEDNLVARRETDRESVASALKKLETFRKAIESSDKIGNLQVAYKQFDDDYPLFDPRITRATTGAAERALSSLRFERSNVLEAFRNVSLENRGLARRYEKVIVEAEKKFGEANSASGGGPRRFEALNDLPDQFYKLAGVDSFEALTIENLSGAVNKYKDVLKTVSTILDAGAKADTSVAFRQEMLKEADAIGNDLVKDSTKANEELDSLEKSITASARALYGDKVGSSSFTYLLVVFAIVFFLIMLIPKFYDTSIALNILKAEFLLQFSTVFVLVAAIIILGIGGLIDNQQLPVLLAGISGYVLGQLGKA